MIIERLHALINFNIMIVLGVISCIPNFVPWYLMPLTVAGAIWFGMNHAFGVAKLSFMKGKGVIEQ